jgi:hypothetical protein
MLGNELRDWNGDRLEVRYSRGTSSVPYVSDWRRNVLGLGAGQTLPLYLEQQVRRYVARRSWFTEADADALAADLGRISRFQSLRSEDGLTWSWFGSLTLAPEQARHAVVQWLYDRLGLPVRASSSVQVTQWSRVRHPNTGGANGPEIDAIIDDASGALIHVEAKWMADLGTGQGATPDTRDDQIVLRRDAMRMYPASLSDVRPWVVLGVSPEAPDLTVYDEPDPHLRRVLVTWLKWDDLAGCSVHPHADEFRRHLEWEQDHGLNRRRARSTPA